ncbi:MAG: hypothetical protein ACXVUE_23750 [Solirubrobacteraceae bacterium]
MPGRLRVPVISAGRSVALLAAGCVCVATVSADAAVSPLARRHSCALLGGGTAGNQETWVDTTPDRGNGLGPKARTNAPGGLPTSVFLRTSTQTFNRRYDFVVSRGRIWFKSNAEVTGIRQPWKAVPLPACFDGQVASISADDDEMIALDRQRHVYTMDYALREPRYFNWTSRWTNIWHGPGRQLPRGILAWSWSVISPREDRFWVDTARNRQPVGADKVSHIWMLNGGGQRLTYNDPWLAADMSYEMCGPHRGRLRALNLSASGSTVFVIDRFGDMYTRLYDFDIAGNDPAFFRYSYEDQRHVRDPAIQLPSPPWVQQPKIPGRITSTISIEKTGVGAVHRILRVEGLDARGHTGFWQKDITERSSRAWRFHRSGQPLHGRLLDNRRGDGSDQALGPAEDRRYVRASGDWTGEIPDFNAYCTPARLRIRFPTGERLDLLLHSVDSIRLTPRARGLDNNPRSLQGTIEVPPATFARRHSLPTRARSFIDTYLHDARFTTTPVQATLRALVFPGLRWAFTRTP